MKRRVEFDPYEQTFEEKIFRGAKRACVVFAVSAVTISLLDLANIRTVENAAAFFNDNRSLVADLPDRIRSGIDLISLEPSSPSATAMIPRDNYTVAAKSDGKSDAKPAAKSDIKSNTSTVAKLSDVRTKDAVEFAMMQPAAKFRPNLTAASATTSELRIAPELTSTPEPALAPMQLASVDMSELPQQTAPVSLPMSAVMPLGMVPIPRAAPGVPPPSPAERLHLEGAARVKAERCLANAIYFEARSEPVRGQMAVAQVVINRAFSGFYPNDICGVVYQNAGRHLACQFTFACDGKSKAINERGNWARANRIAKQTLDGQIYVPEVAKSTHYHAVYVHPNWVGEMKKMVRFGVHNFYRPWAWGNGDEEPVWGSGAVAQNKKN